MVFPTRSCELGITSEWHTGAFFEAAVPGVGCEDAVVADEMAAWSWHERGESGQDVEWLEQELGGAVAKGVIELMYHQPVAVAAQALECDGWAGDVTA